MDYIKLSIKYCSTIGPVERAEQSQVHTQIRLSTVVAGAATRPSDTGGFAVSARAWLSVARSFAQRQCDTAEWGGKVS